MHKLMQQQKAVFFVEKFHFKTLIAWNCHSLPKILYCSNNNLYIIPSSILINNTINNRYVKLDL